MAFAKQMSRYRLNARRLLAARDAAEVAKLHGEHVKTQIEALSMQARELGDAGTVVKA